jgi:DNA invertase Pin-like site-specific DNA recombinase
VGKAACRATYLMTVISLRISWELDKAVVPDFSRFSRKAKYVVAIVNELEQNGVEVESITERGYTNPARRVKDAFILASEGLNAEQIANFFNPKDRRETEQE